MKKKNFKNGLSILQLEERFEMSAAGDRDRRTTVLVTVDTTTPGGPSVSGGIGINF